MLTLVVGVLLGAGAPAVLAYSLPPLLAVGLVLAGVALIIAGAAGLGRSIQTVNAHPHDGRIRGGVGGFPVPACVQSWPR